ncbi:hypothetical protein pb186bvf_019830 [Paramecium bursaria]
MQQAVICYRCITNPVANPVYNRICYNCKTCLCEVHGVITPFGQENYCQCPMNQQSEIYQYEKCNICQTIQIQGESQHICNMTHDQKIIRHRELQN